MINRTIIVSGEWEFKAPGHNAHCYLWDSVWARNYYDEIIYGYGQPEILSLVLTLRLIPSKLRSSNGSKRLSRFEYK